MPRHRRVLDVAEQRGEEVEKAQEKIQKLTRKNSSLQEEKGALESQVAALEVDHGKFSLIPSYYTLYHKSLRLKWTTVRAVTCSSCIVQCVLTSFCGVCTSA